MPYLTSSVTQTGLRKKIKHNCVAGTSHWQQPHHGSSSVDRWLAEHLLTELERSADIQLTVSWWTWIFLLLGGGI